MMRLSNLKIVFIALLLVLQVDSGNNKKQFRNKCRCKEPGMGKQPTKNRKDCNEECIQCSELTSPVQHFAKKGLCVQCKDCNIFGQILVQACTETANTHCVDPEDSGTNMNPQSLLPDLADGLKRNDNGLNKNVPTNNCTCQIQGMGKPPSQKRNDCTQTCINCSDLAEPYQHYEKDGLCVQCMDCRMLSQRTVKPCTETMNTVCEPRAVAQVDNDLMYETELTDDGDHVKNNKLWIIAPVFGCIITSLLVVIMSAFLYKQKNTPANNQNIVELEMEETPGLRSYDHTYQQVNNYQNIQSNHIQQHHDARQLLIVVGGEVQFEWNELIPDTGDNVSQTNSIQPFLQDRNPDSVSATPTGESPVIDSNLNTVPATPTEASSSIYNKLDTVSATSRDESLVIENNLNTVLATPTNDYSVIGSNLEMCVASPAAGECSALDNTSKNPDRLHYVGNSMEVNVDSMNSARGHWLRPPPNKQ